MLNGDSVKCDIMAKYLRQRQLEKMWSYNTNDEEGVILKRAKDDFICQPRRLRHVQDGFFEQIVRLNVKVALSVSTDVIQTYLRNIDTTFVPLADGRRIQVLSDIHQLSRSKKHHFAAFIRSPDPKLLVWHDDPEEIVKRAEQIEALLVANLWRGDAKLESSRPNTPGFSAPSTPGMDGKLPTAQTFRLKEKEVSPGSEGDADEEMVFCDLPRKTLLYQSILIALTGLLCVSAIGVGWRYIAVEISVDGNYVRLAFLAVVPIQIWLGWFFFQTLVTGLAQMFGPVNQMLSNSRSYSGIRSKRIDTPGRQLPHVTVQCPVYKEGLETVIDPTMVSIRAAISTYEMQGGTANIFVNDDGMQLIPDEEARARRDYYEEHNIGWVARPKHNPKPDAGEKAFVRPGKFKKASNMNYAMNVSARVEDRLRQVARGPRWTDQDEDEAYKDALGQAINEDHGRTWADGNIRIGDYILIIDSDTRVPEDCFLDAVSEMEQSPRVAIIQFSSGVMNVTTSFFEMGITYFTNLIYTAISFAVANGDVAPFVGHNAMLRWSALQDIGYLDEGVEKWWAETTVSEDFDMALRLQSASYDVRYSTYFGRGFEEGVSLTVYDELSRWEKYAYGCSELIFHPFAKWPTHGPVTPLFRSFIGSRMPIMAKITILSYIGTYYAISSACESLGFRNAAMTNVHSLSHSSELLLDRLVQRLPRSLLRRQFQDLLCDCHRVPGTRSRQFGRPSRTKSSSHAFYGPC